ncbi:MAG TPA: hypothetical protein VNQ53_11430 [Nocardioides sp.]|nr:hypothetical protein [Nocardioides sp.]
MRFLLPSALFGLALAATAGAQTGPLFPEPFQVEHHLVQDDGDGNRFTGEPVVDTYGGSWIVSQRPDGSRLIVDLERREMTEVRPSDGTYSTVSFDRFAELQARLRAAQGLAKAEEPKKTAASSSAGPVVTEVQGGLRSAAGLSSKPGVRHFRVGRQGDSSALEVWVDPSVSLTPAALAAMDALESAASGRREDAPGRLLSAARSHAVGAVPVRTVRPLAAAGQVEDVTTRLERLERFPGELVQIPEGLRRVPHPLEAAVRFLEEDRERNAAMAAQPDAQ